MNTNGFLYVANGLKYLKEAEISVRSLKDYHKEPIALICDVADYQSDLFDIIVYEDKPVYNFSSKIYGLLKSPFDKTIFLDTDTFVCASLTNIFDILELFDIAVAHEPSRHSIGFIQNSNPTYKVEHQEVFPEFNTGVIAFKMKATAISFLQKWLEIYNLINIKADQVAFRDALLQSSLRIHTLTPEYNFRGILGMMVAHGEVKIVHDRMGESLKNLGAHMQNYDKLKRYSKQINKSKQKRIIIPYLGCIPYYFSPYYVKQKIKKIFGIKRKRKAETLPI